MSFIVFLSFMVYGKVTHSRIILFSQVIIITESEKLQEKHLDAKRPEETG